MSLLEAISKPGGVFAPLVLNPFMARLAEQAGFSAGYLGGGALGFLTCATEANLSLTQMVQAGVEIRAHSKLSLILDGTCGWGDPVHVRHSMHLAEAAGFAAIEIEDQILPKRVHHHIGVEHIVPRELMVDKVREAVAARRSRDFLVIARTNAVRVESMDEALRRGEAMHKAGADLLLVMASKPEDLRIIGERLPHPLMHMLPTGGLAASNMTLPELTKLGYKLVVDSGTPFFAMSAALRQAYDALKRGDTTFGADAPAEEKRVHAVLDLATMLEIERRTVER